MTPSRGWPRRTDQPESTQPEDGSAGPPDHSKQHRREDFLHYPLKARERTPSRGATDLNTPPRFTGPGDALTHTAHPPPEAFTRELVSTVTAPSP